MAQEKTRKVLGTQFIKLDTVGQSYTGTLTDRRAVVINGNNTFRYYFEDDSGVVAMTGTDQLDDALSEQPLGSEIEITFTGTERTLSGFDVKRFTIVALEE